MVKIAASLLVSAMFVFVFSDARSTEDMEIEAKEHLQRVEQFPCKHPQPRSVDLVEDLGVSRNGRETIYPSSTILHRCESSGCCQYPKKCTFVRQVEVDLTFQRRNRGVITYDTVSGQNHTECSCQKGSNSPKWKWKQKSIFVLGIVGLNFKYLWNSQIWCKNSFLYGLITSCVLPSMSLKSTVRGSYSIKPNNCIED